MADKKRQEIIIGKDGLARGVYSPQNDAVLKSLGSCETRRASHVEPGSELGAYAVSRLAEEYADFAGVEHPFAVPRLRPAYANKWFADMTPVGGPVLGPFDGREEALAAEAAWLSAHAIPDVGGGGYHIQIEPITEPVLTEPDLRD